MFNKNIDGCKHNPTISSFKSIESKRDASRCKNCMKKFCECPREHAMEIINLKKIFRKLLKNEKKNENAKASYICKTKI